MRIEKCEWMNKKHWKCFAEPGWGLKRCSIGGCQLHLTSVTIYFEFYTDCFCADLPVVSGILMHNFSDYSQRKVEAILHTATADVVCAFDRFCQHLPVCLPSIKSYHCQDVRGWKILRGNMLVFFCLICQQAEQSSVCFHIRFIQAMCSLKCLFEWLEDRNLFQLAESSTLYAYHSSKGCRLLLLCSHFLFSFVLPQSSPVLPLFFFFFFFYRPSRASVTCVAPTWTDSTLVFTVSFLAVLQRNTSTNTQKTKDTI